MLSRSPICRSGQLAISSVDGIPAGQRLATNGIIRSAASSIALQRESAVL
jgi:hypothetical protein